MGNLVKKQQSEYLQIIYGDQSILSFASLNGVLIKYIFRANLHGDADNATSLTYVTSSSLFIAMASQ